MHNLVVAITGASGAVYALRLLGVLLAAGHRVHLSISPSGSELLKHELGLDVDLGNFDPAQIFPVAAPRAGTVAAAASASSNMPRMWAEWSHESLAATGVAKHIDSGLVYHHYQDFTAGIASGSSLTAGMVICPCSMGTLAAVATGQSGNLIQRAADVHLKERRKLVVVPRETPLGSIQLDNMKRLADAGAVILPASPGFYQNPASIRDLVDFVVARICDQLGVHHDLLRRWGE